MKAQARAASIPSAAWIRAAEYLELAKPRLLLMALLVALAGFYMGSAGQFDAALAFHVVFGTALIGAGAGALNQWMERERDALMTRTRNRPLPSGRIAPGEALAFGAALSAGGVAYLFFTTNALAAAMGAATLALYVFVYTPLKTASAMNTLVGAIPGALPPLIGWAAAAGRLDAGAWSIFLILFLWQIPHFMAIAWRYREDYARAGFRMLPVIDADGFKTGRYTIGQGLALIVASLLPARYGLAGNVYFFSALALGLGFLAFGLAAAARKTDANARRLMWASLLYLPLLFIVMIADKR